VADLGKKKWENGAQEATGLGGGLRGQNGDYKSFTHTDQVNSILLPFWQHGKCYILQWTGTVLKTFSFETCFISFFTGQFLRSEPKLYVIVAVFNGINKGYIPKCWELLQLALLMNSTVCDFVTLPILFHFNIPL
jgi:hypothetical protein